MSAKEQIELAELLDMHFEHHAVDLHTALPARVDAYDPARQVVDVTPQLNRALPDGQGNYIPESLPKLTDVPVIFPRCKAFGITFPLVPGDFVLLVFNERNPGAWRATGAVSNPGDTGMHTLDGAVAIPGFYPDAFPSASADGTKMRIGSDTDPNGRIEFTADEIHLGEGASAKVARNGDPVSVHVNANTFGTHAEANLTGTITNGSSHVKAL